MESGFYFCAVRLLFPRRISPAARVSLLMIDLVKMWLRIPWSVQGVSSGESPSPLLLVHAAHRAETPLTNEKMRAADEASSHLKR